MTRSGPSVIALDVGGTTIKGARIGFDGTTLAEVELPTATGDAALGQVLGLARRLSTDTVAAAALAVPGVIDRATGVVGYAANLGWRNLPLRSLVSSTLGIPVALERDVNAAGVAEVRLGLARPAHSSLVVVLGTGIGASFMIGAELLTGSTGAAGELGHVVVHPQGERCPCGQRGCLEAYASATAVVKRHAARGGDPSLSAADIAMSDDDLCVAVWHEATNALALALTSITHVLDPDRIVLAGGMARAGERLRAAVESGMRAQLAWRAAPRIEVSPLGQGAGRLGAGLIAWDLAGYERIEAGWAPQNGQVPARDEWAALTSPVPPS